MSVLLALVTMLLMCIDQLRLLETTYSEIPHMFNGIECDLSRHLVEERFYVEREFTGEIFAVVQMVQ